jgi:hypothetical protein
VLDGVQNDGLPPGAASPADPRTCDAPNDTEITDVGGLLTRLAFAAGGHSSLLISCLLHAMAAAAVHQPGPARALPCRADTDEMSRLLVRHRAFGCHPAAAAFEPRMPHGYIDVDRCG